ncbi:MAG: putative sugar nucleotidyl transferase [Candidatus Kapabacteria bacterium]|nr:putative sugar nucleotidyl transferase [Candidatus Kapabacteria bacterium]
MNIEQIIIYEQDNYLAFYPFSIMHPVWELRVGAMRLFEKYRNIYPEIPIVFHSKRTLQMLSFLERFGLDNSPLEKRNTLIVTAGFLPDKMLMDAMEKRIEDAGGCSFAFRDRKRTVALYLRADEIISTEGESVEFLRRMINEYSLMFEGAELAELGRLEAEAENLWSAIYHNAEAIRSDSVFFDDFRRFEQSRFPLVAAVKPENIRIGASVKIAPLCSLDATDGKIIIDEDAEIMSGTTIIGPAYIGKNTKIKVGAKIYPGVSIGEHCKIGGEVEDSIIQAYANKQHDGFLGHSFLSEWVNLGAGTNTSDLKNTYGEIVIEIEKFALHSGRQFLGLLCGDHTKSAIGTSFATGTVAGICSSVVARGLTPKSIHSFSFGGEENSPYLDIYKAETIARKVMERRSRFLSDVEIELMHKEFENTKRIFGK